MKSVVSEKGQVTIPKPLRDRLGIQAGQALDFVEGEGCLVATKVTYVDPIDTVFGAVKLAKPTDALIGDLRDANGDS